ncbi:PEFG-CTERM sorting domain-containing protein [Nitrosopumilus sp.]|nr:PEFG-CTERM sorting domain-containing protein [Nitrosopumilus sp.]
MKTQLMIFALFGILITSVGISPAFGENDSIIVTTDKSSYSEGEIIVISGQITYLALGNQLSLIIQSPNGNIAEIAQIEVGSDKQFNAEINPNGVYWKIPGTYTILITQDKNNQATISFEFNGVASVDENTVTTSITEEAITEEAITEEAITEEAITEDVIVQDSIITETTITIQDSIDLISYEIINGNLINVIPDMDAVSLLVYIEATDDGSITLTIPRSVLDATMNGSDDEFFVLIDGEEVDFKEIKTSADRTLDIEFYAGSEQIEIIGTFVIPEFGTIAAMILAVAIISIIAISAKSKLSIQSRY